MLRLMGLFVPVLRENDEMMYQFEHDYRFDSSKIESAFGLRPTPYLQGIRASLGLKAESMCRQFLGRAEAAVDSRPCRGRRSSDACGVMSGTQHRLAHSRTRARRPPWATQNGPVIQDRHC
jgi:hypothetical protein